MPYKMLPVHRIAIQNDLTLTHHCLRHSFNSIIILLFNKRIHLIYHLLNLLANRICLHTIF